MVQSQILVKQTGGRGGREESGGLGGRTRRWWEKERSSGDLDRLGSARCGSVGGRKAEGVILMMCGSRAGCALAVSGVVFVLRVWVVF